MLPTESVLAEAKGLSPQGLAVLLAHSDVIDFEADSTTFSHKPSDVINAPAMGGGPHQNRTNVGGGESQHY